MSRKWDSADWRQFRELMKKGASYLKAKKAVDSNRAHAPYRYFPSIRSYPKN